MAKKNTSNSQKTSTNAGKSQRAGQRQSHQTSMLPAGQPQQQGQGQVKLVSYGGVYGQPAATQTIQGTSLESNTLQNQSATSAPSVPGQQARYPQQLKWRNALTPRNQQGAMAQAGLSSTSASGLGAGAGAYGSTFCTDPYQHHREGGMPPNRGTREAKRSRGQQG